MTVARHRARGSRLVVRWPLAVLGVVLLLAATVLMFPLEGNQPPAAAATGSATTVSGTGTFSGLSVTVAKTKNVINEVVKISWTGGTPTYPQAGSFQRNYLQIMQCWGDDPAGPDRTQCEFGGLAGFDTRGGDYSTTRQLDYGFGVDPKETTPAPEPGQTSFVPFVSAPGSDGTASQTVTGNRNQFYDSSTTNEIAFARTRGDGTGEAFFEMQTAREAAGLQCGDKTTSGPRKCWLVIVPRGDVEVNGDTVPTLQSSPLSQSNWENRIVVPMAFAPVGQACQIGGAERRTAGAETFVEAIGSWQPSLCADGGTIYGFSQTPDSVAKRQVTSVQPEMSFLTRPVERSLLNPDRPLVYAPVTLSALTLSFLVESQSGKDAPEDIKNNDGQRITEINLTPRLVAKLLTQSYRLAVDTEVAYLKDNPTNITEDPDFLAVNPKFAALSFVRGVPDILVPVGLADVNADLWRYISTDEDAVNFVQGLPDQWGMRVNPAYQGLD